jgi:hypothetical protein
MNDSRAAVARSRHAQSLECLGGSAAGAAVGEAWRVLGRGGFLVSLTCRDEAPRAALLRRAFTHASPRADVWAEGRAAPCPTYAIMLLRAREKLLEGDAAQEA